MKQKFYIDFDNTVVDSTKAFCDTYSDLFGHYDDFVKPDVNKLNTWDFKDICPLLYTHADYDVEDIFGMKLFFDKLHLYPNAYDVLKNMSEIYDITIVSIGTYSNLHYKSDWIHAHLPFLKKAIFINNGECKMDKSIINMESESIFMDDVYTNLISSSSNHKYCFGKEYSFNSQWTGNRLLNYEDVGNRFLRR